MKNQIHNVDLQKLNSGALTELFNESLKKILANIDDPNFPAADAREITLKIQFKPNEQRDSISIIISSNLKFPKRYAHAQQAWIVQGNLVQGEDPHKQQMEISLGIKPIEAEKDGTND